MCYFPASIIQLESSPNRPASEFTLTQRRLSSPQVVKAAKANGYQWAATLAEIKPSWVVLRPQEVVLHLGGDLSIPDCRYRLAKVFDATGRIEKLDLYGKGLLSFDSCFLVFHLEKEVAP